ncbi:hypothetical protein, partial [Aeromonas salmonicida]|uniref:hypothetical protein n=2 Tax=Aeromonas salmonicida TaxID=645 RepID=UPI0031D2B2DD
MTRELNSLLARLDDVVERMPDCFNTYEFAQKLALQHQREFFAAGHSLAEQEGRLLRVLHGVVAQISQQIMISPAPSDRYTRGFL